jgi:hypothetical protein
MGTRRSTLITNIFILFQDVSLSVRIVLRQQQSKATAIHEDRQSGYKTSIRPLPIAVTIYMRIP